MADLEQSPGTSASLLVQIRDAGNVDAWRSFEKVYSPLILRYCLRRGLQHADAADVSQEVFARVAKAIRGFDYAPELGRFRSWLGTITANEVRTFFTRTGRHPTAQSVEIVEPANHDPIWMTEFTEHILTMALDRIHGEFEPLTWASFEAVWVRKEPPAQIAQRLGLAVHSVYVNKSRVLKRLEAEVLHLAEDLPFADANQ